MKDVLEVGGYVKNFQLHIRNRKIFDEQVKRFEGKDVEILIRKKRFVRSDPQNKYYWGVVVKTVQYLMNEEGNEFNKQDTHEFLKMNFNYTEKVNENTGEILRVPRSTTRLSKSEFSEFMDKVNRFTMDFFGESIPEANSDLKINL